MDKRTLRQISCAGACVFVAALLCLNKIQSRKYDALISRAEKIERLSGFSSALKPNLVTSDGYLSASAYKHVLASSAEKAQKEYITDWKAKNLKGARQTVKAAAELYNKWDVVDPYTGVSRDDLTPFPLWNKV
jgi:hypothetical protein